MIDKHILDGKVGGRFIKLPCAAATYYKAKGWILTASELANAGLMVSPQRGPSRRTGAATDTTDELSKAPADARDDRG